VRRDFSEPDQLMLLVLVLGIVYQDDEAFLALKTGEGSLVWFKFTWRFGAENRDLSGCTICQIEELPRL
jgi:hypothetical protein